MVILLCFVNKFIPRFHLYLVPTYMIDNSPLQIFFNVHIVFTAQPTQNKFISRRKQKRTYLNLEKYAKQFSDTFLES